MFGQMRKWLTYLTSSAVVESEDKHISNAEDHIFEIMTLAEPSSECKLHFYHQIECNNIKCPGKHLRTLISYIEKAKERIYVCHFMFTLESVITALIKRHSEGVKVYVITDQKASAHPRNKLRNLAKAGIRVVYPGRLYTMHHKFAILDNIVCYGSLNWTAQGFLGNWEYLIITSQPQAVENYVKLFQELKESIIST